MLINLFSCNNFEMDTPTWRQPDIRDINSLFFRLITSKKCFLPSFKNGFLAFSLIFPAQARHACFQTSFNNLLLSPFLAPINRGPFSIWINVWPMRISTEFLDFFFFFLLFIYVHWRFNVTGSRQKIKFDKVYIHHVWPVMPAYLRENQMWIDVSWTGKYIRSRSF